MSSKRMTPCSTRRAISVAVKALVSEPMCQRSLVVTDLGVAERAHAQRRLGRKLAVDLNQRRDRGQVILLAGRSKRLLEEGLKALLGPRE